MSEHAKGNNPIAPGTKITSAWMEYIESSIGNGLSSVSWFLVVQGSNHGVLYPTGLITVPAAEDEPVTATADAGYVINWYFDGVLQEGTDPLFTVTAQLVGSTHWLYCEFVGSEAGGVDWAVRTDNSVDPTDPNYGFGDNTEWAYIKAGTVTASVRLKLPTSAPASPVDGDLWME